MVKCCTATLKKWWNHCHITWPLHTNSSFIYWPRFTDWPSWRKNSQNKVTQQQLFTFPVHCPFHRALEKKQENGETIELSVEGRPELVEEKEMPVVDCTCFGLPRRYIIAILSGIGFCISFGIRCNLGVAIVSMVNSHTIFRDNKQVVVVSGRSRDGSTCTLSFDADRIMSKIFPGSSSNFTFHVLHVPTESSVRLGSRNSGHDPRLLLLGIHSDPNPGRVHLSKVCSKQVCLWTI